jgi:hypothetical protein
MGGAPVPMAFSIEVPEESSVANLIRTRVRTEVERHNAAQSDIYSGLTEPVGATPVSQGWRFPDGWQPVDWIIQAERSIQAFQRNAFFVLVDDVQVEDLETVVTVSTNSQVQFIKLVPLIGG